MNKGLIIMHVFSLLILTMAFDGCRKKSNENVSTNNPTNGQVMYDLAFDKTCSDILGCPLPKSATDIHGQVAFIDTNWMGLVVAKIPEDSFNDLAQKLHVQKKEDLMALWPDVLSCPTEPFNKNYWSIKITDKMTLYYYEDPVEETRVFSTYVSGKFYFKRETKYYMSGTDKEGEALYKKKLKSDK